MVFGDANKQTNKHTHKHTNKYTNKLKHAIRVRLRLARTVAAAAVAPTPTASASSPGARGVPAIVLRLARGRLAVREDFASHRGSRCHQRRRARWRAPSRERKDSLDTIA